jgi:hypothetical protein
MPTQFSETTRKFTFLKREHLQRKFRKKNNWKKTNTTWQVMALTPNSNKKHISRTESNSPQNIFQELFLSVSSSTKNATTCPYHNWSILLSSIIYCYSNFTWAWLKLGTLRNYSTWLLEKSFRRQFG